MNALSALMPTHAKVLDGALANPPAPVVHKYVVISDPLAAGEIVVVFDCTLQHNTIKAPAGTRAVSAGFVSVQNGLVIVNPTIGSDTLGLDPRPQDQALLEKFFSVKPLKAKTV